jgi:predicted esterase
VITVDFPHDADRLLVVLHGHADEPTALPAAIRARGGIPWAIAAPAGPTRCAEGRAWFPSEPTDEGPPLVEVLDSLESAVADACARRGRAPRHVAVLGWSQGAAAALALALRSTEASQSRWRPSLVIGLAPWLVNEPGVTFDLPAAASAGTAVALVHGTRDEIVGVTQGRSTARALERAGVDVTWSEIDVGHELGPLLETSLGWLRERG